MNARAFLRDERGEGDRAVMIVFSVIVVGAWVLIASWLRGNFDRPPVEGYSD